MSSITKYPAKVVSLPVQFSLCGGYFSGSVTEALDDPTPELGNVNHSEGIYPNVSMETSMPLFCSKQSRKGS